MRVKNVLMNKMSLTDSYFSLLTDSYFSLFLSHLRSLFFTCITGMYCEVHLHTYFLVPACSPSRGGDVTVYVKDINQLSLPTPLYSVLVSVSVFVARSTVFHSMNSPENSPFSNSVLPVLSLPYWSFQLYISL